MFKLISIYLKWLDTILKLIQEDTILEDLIQEDIDTKFVGTSAKSIKIIKKNSTDSIVGTLAKLNKL